MYANFDLHNVEDGAQSILKALRLLKDGNVDAAEAERAWMKDKSIDVYVARLISTIGDRELSKLVLYLCDVTGNKFHTRLKQQLLISRKYLSLRKVQERYSKAFLSGRFLADVLERVGVEEYFNILSEALDTGIKAERMSGILKARDVVQMDLDQVQIFILRHMELGIAFSAKVENMEDLPFDYIFPTLSVGEMNSPNWNEKMYWDPLAISGRETFTQIKRYLASPNELNRSKVYDRFSSLTKAEFIDAFHLTAEYLVTADPDGELIMDILDIYLQDFEKISFTQGLALCLSICDSYDEKHLLDYIADLAELVEEDKKAYEDYFLSAVNRFSVPAIFRRFEFTKSQQLIFAFKVFEDLSYSSSIPYFFMQYVAVYFPELINAELEEIGSKAESAFVSQANLQVLSKIAESEPAQNWQKKAEELTEKGMKLSSREWSTGVDSAIRTKNRNLFDFAINGFKSSPDAEPDYFLFHNARYLLTWGEPIEWLPVLGEFQLFRKSKGVSSNEFLQPWMYVWMVRNSAERWLVTLEDFIEQFMYLPSAIDSKVLSALCERYRVAKKTEEIRRVISRFGSRVKGDGNWSLLLLARAYYEVSLPDMALEQLEAIAAGPVALDVKRRAHSYGIRFGDPRVFELFDLNE